MKLSNFYITDSLEHNFVQLKNLVILSVNCIVYVGFEQKQVDLQ